MYELKTTSAHQTLARVVVGFRIFSFVWMSSLVTATLLSDAGAHAEWVWAAEAAAFFITVGAFVMKRVGLLDSPWWVLLDGALTLFIVVAPGLARSGDFFFGSIGVSWLLLLVWAYPSYFHWAVAIVSLIAAQLIDSAIGIRRLTVTRAVGDVAVWIVSGVVYGWAFWIIRDTDLKRQRAEEKLAEEQRRRAAADARTDIALDIHDSVIQAFRRVQQACHDHEIVELAAAQETKFRRYLDRISADRLDGLEVALREAAWEVEDRHDVVVEVVCVEDMGREQGVDALVAAAKEAMTNAARHSGQKRFSVFAEVGVDRVNVFVRDDGVGFGDTGGSRVDGADSRVHPGGLGIKRSIVDRMERAGGSARISSAPGRGTEVELILPRDGHV